MFLTYSPFLFLTPPLTLTDTQVRANFNKYFGSVKQVLAVVSQSTAHMATRQNINGISVTEQEVPLPPQKHLLK